MNKYMMMAAGAVLALASCNNASPKMDEQPTTAEPASAGGLKIAFVEVDSLMTQYNFAKDYSVTLQKKSNNARNTLTQKTNELQAAVNNFLTSYNKDKKFDMILSKSGDNILFANKKFDITQDVINGLNKRYKKTPAKKEEKKDEKK